MRSSINHYKGRNLIFVFLAYFAATTVFTKILENKLHIGFATVDIASVSLWLIGLFLIILKKEIGRLELYIFFFISSLLAYSLLVALIKGQDTVNVYKQIAIPLAALGTFSVIRFVGILRVFHAYLKISIVASVFGIFQWVISLFGIDILVQTPGRLNSFSTEPSHFAVIVSPAFIYHLLHRGGNASLVLHFIALMLTMSSSAILIIIASIATYFYAKRPIYLMFGFVFIAFFVVLSYIFIDEFSYRISDYIYIVGGVDFLSINMTSFSVLSNLYLAIYNMLNFLFGVGLGGHYWSYDLYLVGLIPEIDGYRLYGVNQYSGHSLIIRMVSELGVLGLIIWLLLFIKFIHLAKLLRTLDGDSRIFCIVALSAGGYFLGRIFKLGGYFDFGLWVFLAIFILSSIQVKRLRYGRISRKLHQKVSG